MASIMIRDLDETLAQHLRLRAAEHGRSVEEEARELLREAVGQTAVPKDLGQVIRGRFASLSEVEVVLPERGPMREPAVFD